MIHLLWQSVGGGRVEVLAAGSCVALRESKLVTDALTVTGSLLLLLLRLLR